ncbi:MAG: S1/P1 nuclease [Pyrinomonadaceae bacterium]
MLQPSRLRRCLALSVTLLLLCTICPAPAYAWGNDGHMIVAHIASRLLKPATRTRVNALLGSGATLENVATWADSLRGSFAQPGIRPETPFWHFVDIPLNQNYDPARDCADTPNGNCAIAALVEFQEILSGRRQGNYQNSPNEALKFIVHFAGDIHQPLHCVDDHDHGGNGKKVVWIDNTSSNLHSVWDNAILAENMRLAHQTQAIAYANRLFDQLSAQQKQAADPSGAGVVSQPDIEGWARDAHTIANGAYADKGQPDAQHVFHLTQAYYTNHHTEVDKQLQLAGIRLARILNENLH